MLCHPVGFDDFWWGHEKLSYGPIRHSDCVEAKKDPFEYPQGFYLVFRVLDESTISSKMIDLTFSQYEHTPWEELKVDVGKEPSKAEKQIFRKAAPVLEVWVIGRVKAYDVYLFRNPDYSLNHPQGEQGSSR